MTEALIQSIPVYDAGAITVVNGANLGDGLSFAAELDLDDTYELRPGSEMRRLSISAGADGRLGVAEGTRIGRPGDALHIDCCLTMMSAMGTTTEIIILVEVDGAGDVEAVFALPLSELAPRTEYTLVGIDETQAAAKFAEVACVSFSRGTRITMASGAQKPIEELKIGDMVLTRDDGAQQVRWVGCSTVRAVGNFAPIRIRAGALHNDADLYVSPEHRFFIYQRSDAIGAGRHEVLVRARHLVNGDSIVQVDGGFVDYFQLLFDTHQIIYAEGIAAETLLLGPHTRPALPADLGEKIGLGPEAHSTSPHLDFEVGKALLDHPDAASILRRASTR
ncbi:hypothetical protein D6850_11170 [Roseovarius spongiae]|uniref:Hint domain-containing protein n=1 Tax=Roseovarius spongiae TaxID=2320272 RepID=A0A3A8AUL7_9RHOB|nr:Hint domain-containing protein [Roseovarius spongiae]RKF15369.1 hypothetical protein D6850_11170 [Roseovarius spongiae]